MKRILFLFLFLTSLSYGQVKIGANKVNAGPASGAAAPATYRLLVPADIPSLTDYWKLVGTSNLTGATIIDTDGFDLNVGSNGSATTNNAKFRVLNNTLTAGDFDVGYVSVGDATNKVASSIAYLSPTRSQVALSVIYGGGTTQRLILLKSDINGLAVTDASQKGFFYNADFNASGLQDDRTIIDFGGIKDKAYTMTLKTLTSPQLNSPKLETSSTVGHVWTATNTAGEGSWQAAIVNTFTMATGSGLTFNPADATTYYFGPFGTPSLGTNPTTTAANHAVTTPNFAFTIIGAIITVGFNIAVVGTSELSTLQLRNITAGTSSVIGTFRTDASTSVHTTTTINGLSIAVPASQSVCFQVDTATWATNPQGVRVHVLLICTRP